MPETKTMIRFFTIADYEEEEIWLHEQHKNGWKLHKMHHRAFIFLKSVHPKTSFIVSITKTARKTPTISNCSRITAGSTSAAVSDGCISASPHPFKTPSRTASCFPITNRKLTSFATS